MGNQILTDNPSLSLMVCLEQWMEDETNHGRALNSTQLFQELSQVSETYSIGLPYLSARSFGRQMVQLRSNLEQYFKINITKPGNKTAHAFWPKEEGIGSEAVPTPEN